MTSLERIQDNSIESKLLSLQPLSSSPGFENMALQLSDKERLESLIESDQRIKFLHDTFTNSTKDKFNFVEDYAGTKREYLIYNDSKNNFSVRISPEGFVDVLTQINPTDIEVFNPTDEATVKKYTENFDVDTYPTVTVVKTPQNFRIVNSAEDNYSGGSHRIMANRYQGNSKMWAYNRLADEDGTLIKLFRSGPESPTTIKENLKAFLETK